MNVPSPKPRKILGQIEAMRAVAVTGIFLFHLWSVLPQAGTQNPFGPVLGAILSQGWMGVILFNIVTGFVLTLPFAGPDARPMPGYLAFLRRRFLRICPNYYIGLVFWTAILLCIGGHGPGLAGSFLQHLFFVHTLNPSVFFDIVPAYWWMGLLAQFYLAYPLLWRLFTKLTPKTAATLLIACSLVLWACLELLTKLWPHSIFAMLDYLFYFNLPYRLTEFVLGMYLACLWQNFSARRAGSASDLPRPLRPLRLTALVCLAALIAWGLFFGIPQCTLLATHLYWLAVIVSLGLLMFLSPSFDRIGKWTPIAKLAALSYSIYLMHQPILGYAAPIAARHLAPFPAFLFVTGVCGLVSILAAMATDALVSRINRLIG